ncbi:MAG: hypothetical protein DRI54_04950 [Bacteroidetes bacterium]|nr:MAG: hypothetical protein DRI54_04950 [Bacteroidota bacterium]
MGGETTLRYNPPKADHSGTARFEENLYNLSLVKIFYRILLKRSVPECFLFDGKENEKCIEGLWDQTAIIPGRRCWPKSVLPLGTTRNQAIVDLQPVPLHFQCCVTTKKPGIYRASYSSNILNKTAPQHLQSCGKVLKN